jgi:hypothetical protein
MTAPSPLKAIVTAIAQDVLHISTLEVRGRDALDFHKVGVRDLEQALVCAYQSGLSEMIETLKLALDALNTAPRFRVGVTDSYAIASRIHTVLTKTKGDPR